MVKMNTHEKAVASSDGRRDVDFEVTMKMGEMMDEEKIGRLWE